MISLSLMLVAAAQVPISTTAEPVDFAQDIRPILSDRCFVCHGPGEDPKGDLRLDLREEALADRGGYSAIIPGEPGASEMMLRLRHGDSRQVMPPPASKLTISEAEIALLERWIQEGAVYADHWSFVAPLRSDLPAVVDASWTRDAIDRFTLARMENAGLTPAEETDRATWLRRVSYDLTGLPPTLAELDAFLSAPGAEAFGAELDRLFASTRHAERMASIWLDAARYADTYGYQSDVYREVWPWRDWVIGSYASNQPYDEFLTWQIAGDLLPEATQESRLATAFNRLHRQTNEGGSTEEEYRIDYVADRVLTLSTAVLGLTMECARCHDHKFDALSQGEFYGLSAYFDDIDESGLYSHFTNAVPTPALDLPTEPQALQLAELEALVLEALPGVAAAREAPVEVPADVPIVATDTLAIIRDLQGTYGFDELTGGALANGVADAPSGSVRGALLRVDGFEGHAIEFSGDDPALFPGVGHFRRSDPFTIGLRIWLPKSYERAVILHRSRAWTDSASRGYELLIEDGRASAALIHFWPGNALRVATKESLPLERWVQVTLTWDGSSRAAGLRIYVDGQAVEVNIIRDNLRRTILGGGLNDLTLGERFRDNGLAGGRADDLFVIGRELSAAEVRHLVQGESASPPSAAELRGHRLQEDDGPLRTALAVLQNARRARDDARDAVRQIMTMRDMETERPTYLLERGSYLSPRQEILPHTPASLSPFPEGAPSNRLGLARWLTDPAHPLTARVEVNRLWRLAFGQGLVGTAEDFGSQGDPPSHPLLLDTLAVDLVESGWDRRALLRRMLLSATYRQSSVAGETARVDDPDNRLLSHASRRRLTAEMLRDGALFVSGLLVEKRGGPPVKPYQPAGLWQEKSGSVYQADEGEGLWRRSLYTIWKRTSPPPSMMILDAAKRDVCVVDRQVTSSPLQALLLWNDPQFVEASRMLAERTMREGGDDPTGRIAFLFRSVTSRVASRDEQAILLGLLEGQLAAFKARPADASALLTVGRAPRDESLEPVALASWTIVAQAIFSFDAAITRP
ncbi:MAG: hypothetical protein ACI8QS_000205 [Planctomycetota bacterium]|jgi:hypothetical protein